MWGTLAEEDEDVSQALDIYKHGGPDGHNDTAICINAEEKVETARAKVMLNEAKKRILSQEEIKSLRSYFLSNREIEDKEN